MLPSRNEFGYHSKKLNYSFQRLIEDITVCCNGENITVSSIVQDADQEYSERNMQIFLDDIVNSYPKSQGILTEGEKDYVKTLIYVCVRAIQANLKYVVLPEGCDTDFDINCVTSDTFASLMNHIGASVWQTDIARFSHYLEDLSNRYPVSEDLGYTVTTLYYLLTGRQAAFPSPYPHDEELEAARYGSSREAEAAYYAAEERFEKAQAELLEDASVMAQLNAWSEEQENLEKDEEYKDDMWKDLDAYESAREFRIVDLNDPQSEEVLQRERNRLMFYFSSPETFVQAFEHLEEITCHDFCDIDAIIISAVKAYIREHGLTIYSNPEAFADMFHELYKVLAIVKKNQEEQH